jgi:cobalt-zinc-cadmium efflux system outer membrane protein
MNTHTITGVLIVTLLAGTPALAQQPTGTSSPAERLLDPVNGLSLEQAIALALEREPALQAVRSQIDVAEAMKLQASLKPNPSVSVERREEPAGTDNLTTIGVQWPLDLFRKNSRVAVAEGEVSTARLAAADSERLLRAEVRAKYGELAVATRDLALLDEVIDATRRQYELLRSRADEGASPPLERDLLDVELRRLESERLLQLARTDAASFELRRILGLTAGAALTIRETLDHLVQRDQVSAPSGLTLSEAAEQRADVREAANRIDVAEAKVARAEDVGRFDVSLFGSYMRMDAGFAQRGFAADGTLTRIRGVFHYVSAGAMVTLPLLDRNQGAVAAARAERAGAAAAHEAAKLSAEAELASARSRYAHAQQAVQVYSDRARTLARQNLSVVSQSYELGRLTVFDVMSEQRRYLDVERAYTQTLRQAYEARTALDRALGERR